MTISYTGKQHRTFGCHVMWVAKRANRVGPFITVGKWQILKVRAVLHGKDFVRRFSFFFRALCCVFAAECYVFFNKARSGDLDSQQARFPHATEQCDGTGAQSFIRAPRQLTEAEAAHLVGLSPSWFRHDFKRHARMSFREVGEVPILSVT